MKMTDIISIIIIIFIICPVSHFSRKKRRKSPSKTIDFVLGNFPIDPFPTRLVTRFPSLMKKESREKKRCFHLGGESDGMKMGCVGRGTDFPKLHERLKHLARTKVRARERRR